MSPARPSGIVSRNGVRPIRVFSEKECEVPGPVGDVDARIEKPPDRAMEPYPPGRSCRNLHEPDRRVVDSAFISPFSGVESGFLGNDPCNKDRVDVVLAGDLSYGMGVRNSRREKVSAQTPSNRVMNHPVQCTTS
jgi:hypothetical protein